MDLLAVTFQCDVLRRVFHQLVGQHAQFIWVVPVHPVAQTDRLFGLLGSAAQHPLFAQTNELLDAHRLDIMLVLEIQRFLNVHLDPQALAIESVLPAFIMALHGLVTTPQVLVSAAPGVVHPHWVIGCDGAIDKTKALGRVGPHLTQLIERIGARPERQHIALLGRKINLIGNWFEHGRHWANDSSQ